MSELIAELVLPYLEPRYLLNCRLVDQSWNTIATRLITRAGFHIWLRQGRPEWYMQLVTAAGDESRVSGLQVLLPVNIYPSIDLERSEEIIRYVSKSQGLCVSAMHIDLDSHASDEVILELIKLTRNSLRELQLNFFDPRVSNCEVKNLGFELPVLKSLKIYPAECSTYEIVTTIVLAAPRMEHMDIHPDSSNPQSSFGVLADINSADSHKLRTFLKLELHMVNLDNLTQLNELRFDRLSSLTVTELEMDVLTPLICFIRSNAPQLDELKLDRMASPPWDIDLDLTGATSSTYTSRLQCLPNLTQFGCCMACFSPKALTVRQINEHARQLLQRMVEFENLKHVNFNWDTCIALTKYFNDGGQYLAGCCIWRNVASVDLNIGWEPEVALKFYSELNYGTPQNAAMILQNLFPHVRKAGVTFGERYGPFQKRNAHGMICPALSFIYGFNTVKEAEISSYYFEWTWEETEEFVVEFNQNSTLELLTLRDIRTSGLDYPLPYPQLNLPRLLAWIPSNSTLVFRISSGLLINIQDQKSYSDWEKELANIDTHKITIF